MKPRDYQIEAEQAAWAVLSKQRSCLVIMATGLGKTVLFVNMAANLERVAPGKDTLIIAHRVELLDQAAAKFEAATGRIAYVEQADRRIPWTPPGGKCHIVSLATMTPQRLRSDVFAPERYGLVVVDEAHHATAGSYLRLFEHFGIGEFYTTPRGRQKYRIKPWDGTGPRLLGVTATPKRHDGIAMGMAFESVAYEMDILAGISAGYLVEPVQKVATIKELNLASIEPHKGDFKDADLERLMLEEGPLHQIASPIIDMPTDWQGIVFTPGVAFAHQLANVLNLHFNSNVAVAIDGDTPAEVRRERISGFKRGRYRILVNFGVLTEGFDHDAIRFIAVARPTKSLTLYCQMIGRGTRPLDGILAGLETVEQRRMAIAASRKPDVMILDYVGNSKHKLVSCVDVLGGKYPEIVVRSAREKIEKAGGGKTAEELERARAELITLTVNDVRRMFLPRFAYELKECSLFDCRDRGGATRHINTQRGGATDKQVLALEKLGVSRAEALRLTKHEAAVKIDDLRRVRCSIPQARWLKRIGRDPRQYNFQQASDLMASFYRNAKNARR